MPRVCPHEQERVTFVKNQRREPPSNPKSRFQPIYHVYRVLSGLGTHPTLDVLDSYIDQEPSATFISARRTPVTGSAFLMTITNAIYSTALLAEWLSPSRTTEALEIRRMRSLLEPVDGDTRGWTPGL